MSHPNDIKGSEVTDEKTYFNRRNFLRAGIVAASAIATGTVYRSLNRVSATSAPTPLLSSILSPATQPTTQPSTRPASAQAVAQDMPAAFKTDEPQTPYQDVTHYNNFYEFSTTKERVAEVAEGFVTRPWTVQVSGLCRKPGTLDIEDILKIAPAEERIYRMRCVEAWSMVIPWNGIQLSKILDRVEPLSSAKYVAFTTLFDPSRMQNQKGRVLDWPYVEGLRMDEAMHPLTIMAIGIYGRVLPPQNGAPLRLVVPWKYGFKGIKSIVKIEFTEKEPPTTWSAYAPGEYGFYANVNPDKSHPRWSQATENRIGEGRRPTLPFNGYAEQVAHLYAGMDLVKQF